MALQQLITIGYFVELQCVDFVVFLQMVYSSMFFKRKKHFLQ